MKKCLTLMVAIAMAGGFSASAGYVTSGSHSVYTFEQLSTIDGSGVAKTDYGYNITESLEIAATDTLRISDNDVVRLGDGVQILVGGYADFKAPTKAEIGRISADDNPHGVYILGEEASGDFENLTVHYAGIRTFGNEKGITVKKCDFFDNNAYLSTSGAIVLGSSNSGNVISSCSFVNTASAAIGGAANGAAGVTIENCMFVNCNTENSNRPVLNLTVGCDNPIIIANNTIYGNKNTKVGGIGVSNMLSLTGANEVTIKGNRVYDCRYGLTTIGNMNVVIEGNILVNNRYETNAMNGGSAMSLYDPYLSQRVRVTGNYIEGSLWGITVIGCGNVNLGKTDDPDADDYNPGQNIFVNNGNGGVAYDLYNNSTNTIYAQGNMWNVNEQTPEEIAKVITDKSDIATLGEVICDNPFTGAVRTEPHTVTATANFDKVTLAWKSPVDDIELKWHDGADYNGYDGIVSDPQRPVEMIMAARFTADELKASANKLVEAVDFFEYRDFVEAYAQIYENGKLVRNQQIDLSDFEKNSWRSTVLDDPYVISGNDELMFAIKYKAGYNQDFCAITDRAATAGKGNLVSHDGGLTWAAEAPGDFLITARLRNITNEEPVGYYVYGENGILTPELITENTYTIEGCADGEHKYIVEAVYDGDFVRDALVEVATKAVTSYVPSPATLSGVVENGIEGTISWQAPLSRNEAELTWSNKEYGNSIGATASSPKIWVKQEFEATDLIAYPDYQITAINAWFAGTAPTGVTVYVIKDGVIDYYQEVSAEDVAAIAPDGWTKFTLATPYKLATGSKYAYGYYCTHAKNIKPIGVDNAEAVNTKGNTFSTSSPSSKGFNQSSPSWKTLASGGIAGNFLLTADVEALSEVAAADEIAGYDVYSDGELLASDLTTNTFSETVGELGAKTYTVVAKGASGKVSPAKSVTLTYTLPAEYTAPQVTASNFDAETGKVDIQWSNDAVTLSHCGNAKYTVSFDEDLDIAYGAKFTAEELSGIKGYQIYQLTFIQGAKLESSNLEVYADSELLYSYDITPYEPGIIYTLTLNNPITIPEGKNIYLAYNSSVPAGTGAFVIDEGPGIANGGVVSYNNGKNWLAASAVDADLADYNFVISAKAKPAGAVSEAQAVTVGSNATFAGNVKAHFSEYGIESSVKKSPAAKTPVIKSAEVEKYRVYRNNSVVAETTATSFSEVLKNYGEYNYAVTNVYANGWESPMSAGFSVVNHIEQKPEAPYALRGETDGNNLVLSWETIDADAAVLKYHNGNYAYALGMTSSYNEGYQAILFSSDDIATMNKAGQKLTHIKFHLSSTEIDYLAAIVMLGNNVVFEQNVDVSDAIVGWNVVRLDTPFVIPAGFDVKIGYHTKYAKGIKPLSVDDGPAVRGFGDLISSSTYTWYSLATKYSLDYNFLIEGICMDNDQVLKAPAQGKEEDAIVYNVYRDGVVIASGITEQSYNVVSAASGAYTVTAVVDGVESIESNVVDYDASTGVEGIAAAGKARYDRTIDAVILPEAADAKIYTVGGALVKEVTSSTRISLGDLSSGAYIVKTPAGVVKVVK